MILLTLVLVILCVDARSRGRKGDHISCNNAVNDDMDESFTMMEPISASKPLIKSNTRRYILLAGEKQCREKHDPNYRRHGLVSHVISSTCPGYLMLNYDPNRIPERIVEVRCACKTCLEMTSGNTCMAVKYTRQVLVKKARGCVKAFEVFSVGCTCRKAENATVVWDGPKPLSG